MEPSYDLRFHSFYAAHKEGAYEYLMDGRDLKMMPWVREFSSYDLYSKSNERPDQGALRPYYEDLIADFLPGELGW